MILLALLLVGMSAHAQTISLTGCAAPAWNAQTLTLACGGTVPPVVPPIVPPVNPPGGAWDGTCPSVNGLPAFDRVNYVEWNWAASPSHIDLQMRTNDIAVIGFVATGPADVNNVTSTSATGYPAPNLINTITLAISTKPCDLTPAEPGSSSSTSPTISYGVGSVPIPWATHRPTAVALVPGGRYFLNVANRDQYGMPTCVNLPTGWNCDVRLSPQKPPGH